MLALPSSRGVFCHENNKEILFNPKQNAGMGEVDKIQWTVSPVACSSPAPKLQGSYNSSSAFLKHAQDKPLIHQEALGPVSPSPPGDSFTEQALHRQLEEPGEVLVLWISLSPSQSNSLWSRAGCNRQHYRLVYNPACKTTTYRAWNLIVC